MKINYLSKLITLTLIWFLTSCRPYVESTKDGGTKYHVYTKCTKPSKHYAKSVEIALKGSVAKWESVSGVDLTSSVKTEVIKLADYSSQGLDLDLLLFRVCEMANNRALSTEQMNEIISLGTKTWNNRMSINEQKNIISQLNTELESNLKTANELKLNTETILSNLNLISGDQILRNQKIQILPLLFPITNLDKNPTYSVSDLVTLGLAKYQTSGLDTNKLEKDKFSAIGRAIALTLDKTLPTINSLADKEGTRYPVYSTIWSVNATNLSKIDIFDVTKFQQTYSELNSLKANYNIVIGRATDYLADLNNFFKPANNVIKRDDIEKVLTSERLAYDLINTYSKSLLVNIENLTKLQQVVKEALN
jgi:hypothetical protein